MPEDKKKALVDLLARHEVPLIEDDVYAELYFGDKRPAPAKAFDTQGLVLHCGSFSKCLAPGYRIGWAAPGRFAQAVARQKLTTTLSASAPAQVALGDLPRNAAATTSTCASCAGRWPSSRPASRRPSASTFRPARGPRGRRAATSCGSNCREGIDALAIHRQALSLGHQRGAGADLLGHARGFTNCLRLNYGHAWDARSGAGARDAGTARESAPGEGVGRGGARGRGAPTKPFENRLQSGAVRQRTFNARTFSAHKHAFRVIDRDSQPPAPRRHGTLPVESDTGGAGPPASSGIGPHAGAMASPGQGGRDGSVAGQALRGAYGCAGHPGRVECRAARTRHVVGDLVRNRHSPE